jgi:hypothetical protein
MPAIEYNTIPYCVQYVCFAFSSAADKTVTIAMFSFPFLSFPLRLFQPRRLSKTTAKDGSGPTPIPAMRRKAQPAPSIWLGGCSWLLRPLETGPGGPKSVLSSRTWVQAGGPPKQWMQKANPTVCEDLPVVRAEGDLRCNRLQKPPDRHMSLFSFPRASDWTATVGHCFTPGHCHFAPRHLLVLGVLNSHRNLESHQVTLPSSSYAILYIYSQGTAEHRDHRASPNCFLSRFDQRGSSHTMDDHQITCNLKDKAQEGSHTRSNSCYLSLIQHLHYKKPCPSLYPVIFNIKGPAYTLPLQDLSLQPTNISLCVLVFYS